MIKLKPKYRNDHLCVYCKTATLKETSQTAGVLFLGCVSCNTVYEVDPTDTICAYYFSTLYKDKFYRAVFHPGAKKFFIFEMIGNYTGKPPVAEFDYLPKGLTPYNFLEKLPTLILFS